MSQIRESIAFCGLDCAVCPAFVATQTDDLEGRRKVAEAWSKEYRHEFGPEDCVCDGCHPYEGSRLGRYCKECPIRACGRKKNYPNCAYCPDYPCANLGQLFTVATDAKAKLDAVRRQMCRE